MKASFAALMMATAVQAIDPLPYLNVVQTDKSCNLDSDCSVSDLDYIEGNGKPKNSGEICCATFPRETWNESS